MRTHLPIPSPLLRCMLFLGCSLFFLSVCAQEMPKRYVELPEGVIMEFVRIPAGHFLMGSDTTELERHKDEDPVRRVTLSQDFYIGRYEVTQAQWRVLMNENPAVFKEEGNLENMPVDYVSWNDCQLFIKKLNALDRGTFRLPTEAEWEYACRAGTKSRFDWGEDPQYKDLNRYAWFYSRAEGRSHAVGEKLPNPWGLYDMYGNHWEWCADWKDAYPSFAETDPQGPAAGEMKVIRGGSWFNEPAALRAANRNAHEPDSRQTNIGLRLVWEP